MPDRAGLLPSWRPGATREAVLGFIDAAESLPTADRVAAFDNDGTLWCEKPSYVQVAFFVDALRQAVAGDSSIGRRPEYAALLDGDQKTMAAMGLERIALALADLFTGLEPMAFTERVRSFMAGARHESLDRPLASVVYQPMIELLDELRRRDFTTFIVTGGGTEFVRAISLDLYDVAPEAVVGTLVRYEYRRDTEGRPGLRRTAEVDGLANEGPAKVAHIQSQLGRRPILGAGNTGGDREMLEWASTGSEPSLALVIDHDDGVREFEYAGAAATYAEDESILESARRLGWTVVSMANDWDPVFRPAGDRGAPL